MTTLSINPDVPVLARVDRTPRSTRRTRSLAVAAVALGIAGSAVGLAAAGDSSEASSGSCHRAAVAWPSGDAAPPEWPSAAGFGADLFAASGPAITWPSGAPSTAAWPATAEPLRCL